MAQVLLETIAGTGWLLDQCAEASYLGLSDDEVKNSIIESERLLACWDANVRLPLIEQARLRGLPKRDGAKCMSTWLKGIIRIGDASAKKLGKLAQNLFSSKVVAGGMTGTTTALANGAITTDQAAVIAQSIAQLPPDLGSAARAAGEASLAADAGRIGTKGLDVETLTGIGNDLYHSIAPTNPTPTNPTTNPTVTTSPTATPALPLAPAMTLTVALPLAIAMGPAMTAMPMTTAVPTLVSTTRPSAWRATLILMMRVTWQPRGRQQPATTPWTPSGKPNAKPAKPPACYA